MIDPKTHVYISRSEPVFIHAVSQLNNWLVLDNL